MRSAVAYTDRRA